MELTVGAVLEGKVKSITNFGAFVALPENKTGMVHISEVANAYVSDIRQHLTEGQDVKVMVIGTDNGKINLSIKRLEPKPQRDNTNQGRPGNFRQGGAPVGKAASSGREASRTSIRIRHSPSSVPSVLRSSPPHPRPRTSCLRKS